MEKRLKIFHLAFLILLCVFVIIVSVFFSNNVKESDKTKEVESKKNEEKIKKGDNLKLIFDKIFIIFFKDRKYNDLKC